MCNLPYRPVNFKAEDSTQLDKLPQKTAQIFVEEGECYIPKEILRRTETKKR